MITNQTSSEALNTTEYVVLNQTAEPPPPPLNGDFPVISLLKRLLVFAADKNADATSEGRRL